MTIKLELFHYLGAVFSPRYLVEEFHGKVGAETNYKLTKVGSILRQKFLLEEFKEYLEAEMDEDPIKVADALGDMIYVIYGTALQYGIDLDRVVGEIHKSNMTKDANGNGKAIKGDKYIPADLTFIVNHTL